MSGRFGILFHGLRPALQRSVIFLNHKTGACLEGLQFSSLLLFWFFMGFHYGGNFLAVIKDLAERIGVGNFSGNTDISHHPFADVQFLRYLGSIDIYVVKFYARGKHQLKVCLCPFCDYLRLAGD